MRSVAIFSQTFLPLSQTFVRDHMQNLKRYRPIAVAQRRAVGGMTVDDVPLVLTRPEGIIARRIASAQARINLYPSVRRGLKRSGADIVHAHFGPAGSIVRAPCRHLDLPLIVTFHGYDVTVDMRSRGMLAHRRDGRQRRMLFGQAARIITVSQFLAGRLVEQGVPPSKLHVIPCGVETSSFEVTPIPINPRVAFVGRLVEKKGCDILLRALHALHADVETVVVGDGPLRARLEQQAIDLKLNVEFRGAQPNAVVRDEIRRARAVVIPSRTSANGDQEGLPVAALEAAASGRPVVASRHSGLPEAVLDGQTGLLVREGDVKGLAAALEQVMGDYTIAEALGSRARCWVKQRFELSDCLGQVEDMYDEILGGR